MNVTGIEWTTFSANPLKYRDKRTGKVVWGCVKKSPGCAHCYAEQLAKRYGRGGSFNRAEMEHLEPFLDEAELRKMLTAKTVGGVAVAGSRCFVGDMTDLFGEWVPDLLLDCLFATFALRDDVTFQVLTKRADRMTAYMARLSDMQDHGLNHFSGSDFARALVRVSRFAGHALPGNAQLAVVDNWPLKNVWCGVSVENQAAADERIPHLLRTPAVRFLSCEPLLSAVEFSNVSRRSDAVQQLGKQALGGISWVICGGESGPGSRPCRVEWLRSIVAQCKAANVACFVKQLGSNPEGDTFPDDDRDPATGNRTLHVRQSLTIRDKKGGDIAEFPADLRVREFPTRAPA